MYFALRKTCDKSKVHSWYFSIRKKKLTEERKTCRGKRAELSRVHIQKCQCVKMENKNYGDIRFPTHLESAIHIVHAIIYGGIFASKKAESLF